MSLFDCRQVRRKWYSNILHYYGIRKVISIYGLESKEYLMLENLLASLTDHASFNNKYYLYGGIDVNLYENEFRRKAINFMTLLNVNSYEDNFLISYSSKKKVIYVTLQ